IYSLRKGTISDLDAQNRKERIPTYTLTLIGWTIGLVFVKLWGNDTFLRLYFSFFILIFILVFITYFYKVSIHAALNTALFLFINLYPVGHPPYGVYGNWRFWGFLFLIPLVLWARWYKKNHDGKQLLLGVLVGGAVILVNLLANL
ncbi:MAG: hypothetical protein FJ044_03835, partial [Candidatus Cloacimonetes bacterium]|nr:hypothetical protein [Candidatus Cloacimonadota bacterium]